jgi:hypothetical protein
LRGKLKLLVEGFECCFVVSLLLVGVTEQQKGL